MIESLHTHTTLSDGKLSHRQMFELSRSLDVSVVAFTDHDAVPDERELAYLESIHEVETKWIIGIEITARVSKELISRASGSLHVIGLFIDPKNVAIIEHCEKAQDARVERMKKIVCNLQNLGFTLAEEDCLKASGGESVGRPHIVEALFSHPENRSVTERLAQQMEEDSRQNPALRLQYERMIEMGESQFPYTLFLSDDSYQKAYVETSFCPDLDEAVSLIRSAGGIASIAHYFTVKNKMPLFFAEQLLKEKRIDGMETVYGMRLIGKSNEDELENEKMEIKRLLRIYDGIETGGSDAHTEKDMRQYASLKEFSAKSAGMAKKILDSGKVDKRFSSF